MVTDTLRELCTVASYTRVGFRLRERGWNASEMAVDMTGRTCVVTGGSRGLGYAAAQALVARGATVVLVCRDPQQGARARDAIAAIAGDSRIVLRICDVSAMADVRDFAEWFAARFGRLDVLVNNAAALFRGRQRSADGHDSTFATNVLGGFYLTHLLLPSLIAEAPSRVVHVGSAAMYLQRLDVDALLRPGGSWAAERAYAHSKRALAELNELWAERLAGTGVTSNLVHPGLAATAGVRRTFPRYHRWFGSILRDPPQGADTMVWLAVARAAAGESGKVWFDRTVHPSHALPWTRAGRAERVRLWETCASLCGVAQHGGEPSVARAPA